MKIAICNQKGGSGKTTAVMLLAYALGAAGKQVGIIDRDPQQTARRWLENAPAERVKLVPERGRADEYDLVLVDTPPYLKDGGFDKAVREADRVVLVCSTSPLDVWSTQEALGRILQIRPEIRPAVLFSRYEAHTEFGKTREDFAKALGVRMLANAIPERKSIQRASIQGYRALRAAERENLANLALEIITLKP